MQHLSQRASGARRDAGVPGYEPTIAPKPALPTTRSIAARSTSKRRASGAASHRPYHRDLAHSTGRAASCRRRRQSSSTASAELAVTTYKRHLCDLQGSTARPAWAQITCNRVTEPVKLNVGLRRAAILTTESEAEYAQITVRGSKVNGRDAYRSSASAGEMPESRTSTPDRTAAETNRAPTPIGTAFQTDFDDYRYRRRREVPFVMHMTPANARTELAPDATSGHQVEDSVAIDNAKFAKVAPPGGR